MRILFFSNNPADYYNDTLGTGYHGVGWVTSLVALVKDCGNIGFCFFSGSRDDTYAAVGGVEYFPVYNPYECRRGRIKKLLPGGFSREDRYLMPRFLEVIDRFCPDVIVVFGSERSFGLVATKTDIPVILHIQGLIGPCYRGYFPPGASMIKYILEAGGFTKALTRFYKMRNLRHAAKREAAILGGVRNFLCRTAWDKAMVAEANPSARIFHCDEVLRPQFYSAAPWKPSTTDKPVFVTTISEPPYKGMDVILRAGAILSSKGFPFEWKVYGNVEPRFFEKLTGITCREAGITICGPAPAEEIARALCECTAYIHPSYMDNSPNSVCEAQIIGAPVIATRTGGIPSLIEEGATGMLFPTGDAEALAELMHKDLSALSAAEREKALIRHDKNNIKTTFITYLNSLKRN